MDSIPLDALLDLSTSSLQSSAVHEAAGLVKREVGVEEGTILAKEYATATTPLSIPPSRRQRGVFDDVSNRGYPQRGQEPVQRG